MKIIECSKCGCERIFVLKAEMRDQQPTGISVKTKWVCFPCLMEMVMENPKALDKSKFACFENDGSVPKGF